MANWTSAEIAQVAKWPSSCPRHATSECTPTVARSQHALRTPTDLRSPMSEWCTRIPEVPSLGFRHTPISTSAHRSAKCSRTVQLAFGHPRSPHVHSDTHAKRQPAHDGQLDEWCTNAERQRATDGQLDECGTLRGHPKSDVRVVHSQVRSAILSFPAYPHFPKCVWPNRHRILVAPRGTDFGQDRGKPRVTRYSHW